MADADDVSPPLVDSAASSGKGASNRRQHVRDGHTGDKEKAAKSRLLATGTELVKDRQIQVLNIHYPNWMFKLKQ